MNSLHFADIDSEQPRAKLAQGQQFEEWDAEQQHLLIYAKCETHALFSIFENLWSMQIFIIIKNILLKFAVVFFGYKNHWSRNGATSKMQLASRRQDRWRVMTFFPASGFILT